MKKIDVCVGTDRDRNIRVRLSLLFVDEQSGSVIAEHYHSGILHPGDSPQALKSSWDTHLASTESGIPGAPWPKIPDEEWAEVEQIVSILHTPERIAKRVADDAKARFTNAAQAVRK